MDRNELLYGLALHQLRFSMEDRLKFHRKRVAILEKRDPRTKVENMALARAQERVRWLEAMLDRPPDVE